MSRPAGRSGGLALLAASTLLAGALLEPGRTPAAAAGSPTDCPCPADACRWQLQPDTAGPVAALVFQMTPAGAGPATAVAIDLLDGMDPLPEVHVVVETAAHARPLADALAAAGLEPPGGLRIVETGRPLTIWAKDRFAAAACPSGDGWALLVPPPVASDDAWKERVFDRLVPAHLAAADERLTVRELPFRFDGGDLLIAGRRVFVDWNFLERNRSTIETVGLDAFVAEVGRVLGSEVVVLGDGPGSVPNHHIGMYLTAVDDETVLLGDPRLARRLLGPGAATRIPEGDFAEATAARFDRLAEALEGRGLQVVRLPLVPWAHDVPTFVTYNNVLLDGDRTRPIVHLSTYDLPELDEAAAAIYGRLGFEVRPVDVGPIYRHHGTLRCLPGVLRALP